METIKIKFKFKIKITFILIVGEHSKMNDILNIIRK